MSRNHTHRMASRSNQLRRKPQCLLLEDRITPATASLASGTLTINYTFTGTTLENVSITNDGSNINVYGDVTGSTLVSMTNVNKIVVQDSGNSNNQYLTFDVFSAKPYALSNGLTSTGVEVVEFDTIVTATGTGAISITAPKTIIVYDNITTANGDITLKGNTQVSPSTGSFDGIDVMSGTISSTTGNITLQGRGGDALAGDQWGVLVYTDAVVGSGTTGKVTITGTGGASSGPENMGVVLFGGGTVTSGGGNVSVTGTAGGTGSGNVNFGVYVDGQLSAGGTGTITVIGTGGATSGDYNYGVYVLSTGAIASSGGSISITGQGGGSGASLSNHGVVNDGPITAVGAGGITIQGTGGSTSGASNVGAYIFADVTTVNGSISINGQGGGTGAAPSCWGVFVDAYTIAAGGAGTVAIQGTGAATTATSVDGVFLSGSSIKSNSGKVDITGIQGNSSSEGVHVESGAAVLSGGSAALTINATGATNLSNGTLTAGGNMTFNSTGPIIQFPAGAVLAPSGTMTVNALGQVATFGATGNKATQLVIAAGVTAFVNGSFDATGAVQVDGVLGGSGTVGTVTVTGTGKVAPGKSPGLFSTGNIAFNAGSIFSVEINGANAITEYDQLAVTGTVTLGGATLQGSVTGYTPTLGKVYKIIDNNGTGDAVTGTFNGVIEGGSVNLGGFAFAVSYKGGDGNDVTLTRISQPPPTVVSAVISDGSGLPTTHRSQVRQIIVTFSEAVNFTGAVANAFTVHRTGNSGINGNPVGNVQLIAAPATGPASTVTITFNAADTTLVENLSLKDGLYNFTIDATQVIGAGGNLDGDLVGGAGGNYTVTGTIANKWFRLFGDDNGDGTVNQTDFNAFRLAFLGGPSTVFDFDNDGQVSQPDYNAFRLRFLGSP